MDVKTPQWFGFFLAAIVMYLIIAPSLGIVVTDYIPTANRILDMSMGALLTLFVAAQKQ